MLPKRVISCPIRMPMRTLANLAWNCDRKVKRHQIHREAAATREAVAAAVDVASEFADSSGLSLQDSDRLRLVVEELVTNVVNHGRVTADSKISYGFEAEADAVKISITDRGAPFDPRSGATDKPGPNRTREGGWGWPIILAWCHIEDYRREDDRNHLLLRMPAEFKG